jgi:hypothetical protein
MTVPNQNDVLEDPLKLFLDTAHPAEFEFSHDRGAPETPIFQSIGATHSGASPTLRQAQNQRGSE